MNSLNDRTADFFRVMDRVRRAWRKITPCDFLNKSQLRTLMEISRQTQRLEEDTGKSTGVPLSVLACAMNLSLPALSQRMRTLEELGYIERVPDPCDRRVIGLRLTLEGEKTKQEAHEHFTFLLTETLNRLGPENSRQLIELLSLLAQAFEETGSQSYEQKTTVEDITL